MKAVLAQAKDSAVACALYLDNHVFGGVTFGQKLWRGANRTVGAWGHTPACLASTART
jgi:predicted NBD/HSP70 family sugar kinase